jgi:hypothetical protein
MKKLSGVTLSCNSFCDCGSRRGSWPSLRPQRRLQRHAHIRPRRQFGSKEARTSSAVATSREPGSSPGISCSRVLVLGATPRSQFCVKTQWNMRYSTRYFAAARRAKLRKPSEQSAATAEEHSVSSAARYKFSTATTASSSVLIGPRGFRCRPWPWRYAAAGSASWPANW